MTKPIKLYSHATGPNPWKVVIIMEELAIPYEAEMVDFKVIKQVSTALVNNIIVCHNFFIAWI